MMNVIIGVIAVLLFIALAVAAALYFGPQFANLANGPIAGSVINQLSQIVEASEMYKLKNGKPNVPAIDTSFLVPRFLKSIPVNPSPAAAGSTSYDYQEQLSYSIYLTGARQPAYAAKYALVAIGPAADARSKGICLEIAHRTGLDVIPDYTAVADPSPVQNAGCVTTTAAAGGVYYLAYRRVESAAQPVNTASGYTGS